MYPLPSQHGHVVSAAWQVMILSGIPAALPLYRRERRTPRTWNDTVKHLQLLTGRSFTSAPASTRRFTSSSLPSPAKLCKLMLTNPLPPQVLRVAHGYKRIETHLIGMSSRQAWACTPVAANASQHRNIRRQGQWHTFRRAIRHDRSICSAGFCWTTGPQDSGYHAVLQDGRNATRHLKPHLESAQCLHSTLLARICLATSRPASPRCHTRDRSGCASPPQRAKASANTPATRNRSHTVVYAKADQDGSAD